MVLAIESSCDETSAAVLHHGSVLSTVVASQVEHSRWGGVIPEIASRAHLKVIDTVVRTALEDAGTAISAVDAIAVTTHPGLAGALVVGANYAKGLGLRYGIPVVPVDHIEGHLFSPLLEHPDVEFPFVALVVSGGHTAIFAVTSWTSIRLVGSTRDDAAGEAFDKIAKLLGLGYPGGPELDRRARAGNPRAIDFPRPMLHAPHSDFSFSGLKSSVRRYVQLHHADGTIADDSMADICASAQEAIADVLTAKAIAAARKLKVKTLAIVGGVSANSRVRSMAQERAGKLRVVIPSMKYCTDNAAMIGLVGSRKMAQPDCNASLRFSISAAAIRADKHVPTEEEVARSLPAS